MEKIALPYYDKNGKRLMVPGMKNAGFDFDEEERVHTGLLFGKKVFYEIKTLTVYAILNNRVIGSSTSSIKNGFSVKIREN